MKYEELMSKKVYWGKNNFSVCKYCGEPLSVLQKTQLFCNKDCERNWKKFKEEQYKAALRRREIRYAERQKKKREAERYKPELQCQGESTFRLCKNCGQVFKTFDDIWLCRACRDIGKMNIADGNKCKACGAPALGDYCDTCAAQRRFADGIKKSQ